VLVAAVSGSYDAGGFLFAFILAACVTVGLLVLYAREARGQHRNSQLRKYRSWMWGPLFVMFLAGLRRFVLHV
jgi:hypothetical protein